MKRRYLCIVLIWLQATVAASWAAGGGLSVDQILDGLEKTYAGKGFCAMFFQESMLKALQISDTAEGRLTVKRPGKMRWDYVIPDEQHIITDGQSLWIYRPADNQVMMGAAPDFFGQGKGAGFLSNIRQIRDTFSVEQKPAENEAYLRLRLVPKKTNPEISELILSVFRASFQVDQVISYNAHGDETRIILKNYQFNIDPEDALFTFTIPDGVDVVRIDTP